MHGNGCVHGTGLVCMEMDVCGGIRYSHKGAMLT